MLRLVSELQFPSQLSSAQVVEEEAQLQFLCQSERQKGLDCIKAMRVWFVEVSAFRVLASMGLTLPHLVVEYEHSGEGM